jgi:hypothetical protein
MAKEGYKPTAGMKAAARRAIKWKEQGKATGAGTPVGWTRAGQLVRGEALSLDTVKRMYSFFSRHEVDKKGKDFNNTSNPSNGRIMWDAWGGDAGYSWSRKIVEREKNMKKYDMAKDMKKSMNDAEEILNEIKTTLDDIVDPITDIIEIEDDVEVTKALRPEVTREQLYAVVEALHEAIESMLEMPEEDMEEEEPEDGEDQSETIDTPEGPTAVGDPDKNKVNWPIAKAYEGCSCETCKAQDISCESCPECVSKSYESDNEDEDKWDNMQKACWNGYKQEGMKEKNGRMVPNCVPVEKMETVKKSLWSGIFK